MPIVSMFYGIIIKMFYNDHNPPHLHAEYQGYKATFNFDGNLVEGEMPDSQKKLIIAWIELHKDELAANWQIAKEKQPVSSIDPLR